MEIDRVVGFLDMSGYQMVMYDPDTGEALANSAVTQSDGPPTPQGPESPAQPPKRSKRAQALSEH